MKKPIRILFDARPIVDKQMSGVGYYIEGLIRALAETYPDDIELVGFYFNFLNRKRKSGSVDEVNVQYKAIRFVPGKVLSLTRLVGWQPPIECFVNTRHIDVILWTNYISLPSLRKTPSADIVYDLGCFDAPKFLQQKNLQFLQKFLPSSIRRSRVLVTISNFTKQRIVHHFPAAPPIVVTPIPPVVQNSMKAELSEALSKKGIKPGSYLLYIGTVEPRKNIAGLVEAYCLLDQKIRSQYALVLAGGKGWNDQEIIELIVQKQQQGFTIIQTGYISDEEKAALYKNARLFVLASHYEGFGMPILEAFQHKLPVALSNIDVFREVAGNAAWYFDKDYPADIAKTIQAALDSPKTSQGHAMDQVLSSVSWQKNAHEIHKALKGIASR